MTAVVGLAAASASGAIELDSGGLGTVAVVLVWFLLGFLLWSTLYAIGGVMVSRQEDLQSSTTVLGAAHGQADEAARCLARRAGLN